MIRDLTRWDRRRVAVFIIIAVVASGFGTMIHSTETRMIQGLPFSFFRYVEPASEQDPQGRLAFIAPAFMLDVIVWYMIAYLAIRFYDNSSPVLAPPSQQSMAFSILLLASFTVLTTASASTVLNSPSM